MNTYEKVKQALEDYPESRNSDKKLIWYLCGEGEFMSYNSFMNYPPFESITRARRAVQKHHPELQATEEVKKNRNKKSANPNGWLY